MANIEIKTALKEARVYQWSVDNHYISKKTGLSEQSINILSNRENGRDIIDSFISMRKFFNLSAISFCFGNGNLLLFFIKYTP